MKPQLLAFTIAGAMLAGGAAFAADQTIKSNELRASKIVGSSVYDHDNQKVGSVQDIILGTGGKVDSVIVDVGTYLGMGGKDVALRMSDIKTDNDRLTLSKSKAQLQAAPSYHLTNDNTGAGKTASLPSGGNATVPH